jgi:type IV pilus assembly protein PilV
VSAPRHSARRPDRARGYTLIEVLVSLVILGIGVLGIAKLTLFSVRSNDSAYLRTQANALAQAGSDYLRANRTVALTGAYNIALGATAPAAPNCLAPATCAAADLANYDLSQWLARIAAALPSGQGAITTVTVGNDTTAVVTVQWDDAVAQQTYNKSAAGVAAPMKVTLETVL